jgi:predicted permease
MTRFKGLRRLFRLDRTADVERNVDAELRFHFDLKVRELMDKGLSEAEARREAERRFGDVALTREQLAAIDRERVGQERRAEWWSALFQDLRYAARGLRLKPGFTAGVVLTLGLGIGANATMFGIVDRLLFRPPAYLVRPDEVHRVYFIRTFDGKEFPTSNTSYKRYHDLTTMTSQFSALALFFAPKTAVGTGDDARELTVQGVSASFWSFFDARPVIGRFFTADEDQLPAGTNVVVLAYAYWRTQFGARRDVIGTRLTIGHAVYAIIGVAPKGFMGVDQEMPVAFIPASAAIADQGGGPNNVNLADTYGWQWPEVLVRRRPNASAAAATADLTRAYQRSYEAQIIAQPHSAPAAIAKPHAVAGPVLKQRGPRQEDATKVAIWLIGVAAIVLVIACANVGNLLLARAFGRRREIAVRLALGISRSRLLAQLLTESVLLALLGAAAGIAIAQWGGGVLRATLLPDVSWTSTIADPRVLGFAAAVALAAGILAGLAPVVQARRVDVASALKAGVREGTYHRSRLRSALLVTQGALSVVLLVGAGLFVRSFRSVRHVPLGYDAGRLLSVSLQMRGVKLTKVEAARLRQGLVDRAMTVPGVERAARTLTTPFWNTWSWPLVVPGLDTAITNRLDLSLQAASPGYFETMGTHLLQGRAIGAEDGAGAPLAMVVSRSLAKALWPDRDPLGQCAKIGADTVPCHTVVGVVEDVKHSGFRDDPGLNYYLSSAQWRPEIGGLTIRARGDPVQLTETVRHALQTLMPAPAYVTVTPLAEIVAPNMRQWELGATMFSIFGGLALLVAAVGLYSVVAYGVAQRTHELGVRVALGAQTRDVVRLVLGEGLRLAAIAVAIGTIIAMVAGRWVAPLLFDTSPRDPAILAGVAALLVAISAAASFLPALRAARVDPNIALRAD